MSQRHALGTFSYPLLYRDLNQRAGGVCVHGLGTECAFNCPHPLSPTCR